MHFNYYFVEHIRRIRRGEGGGGVITYILNKEGGSFAIYVVCRRGLTEILIFPTYRFPPPLYINNDRSPTIVISKLNKVFDLLIDFNARVLSLFSIEKQL